MTPTQRLKLINHLLYGSVGLEADCLHLEIIKGRKVTEREKQFAELLMHIYRVAHPNGCKHKDWDEVSIKELKQYDNNFLE